MGVEALAIQGWPVLHERFREAHAGKESPFLMSLAGNAFPGTIIVVIICAMAFAAEGVGDEHASSVDGSSAAASIALLQKAREVCHGLPKENKTLAWPYHRAPRSRSLMCAL